MDSCGPHEIDRRGILRREDFDKLSVSLLALGKEFKWLGAYFAGALRGSKGLSQVEDLTAPWLLCSAGNWPDLYLRLTELEQAGRITWPIILDPSKAEPPQILRANLGDQLDQLQGLLRAKGIMDLPRNLEQTAKFVKMGVSSQGWRSRGGKTTAEELGVPKGLKKRWQAKAEEMWRQHPKLSARTVARLLSNNYRFSEHTIRKYLQKPRL